MGEGRRKRICFCAAASDDHKPAPATRERRGGDVTPEAARHRRSRRGFLRRFLGKIFTSPSLSREEKERITSDRSLASTGSDSGSEDDDRKSASIFTSSSASASSSSSSSSSRSLSATTAAPELDEPTSGQNRAPHLPVARNPALRVWSSERGMLLVVVNLSVMVFYGRMWAIFWTSLWLYLEACLLYGRNGVAEAAGRGGGVSEAGGWRIPAMIVDGSGSYCPWLITERTNQEI